jgi:hypothetical protein
MKAIVLAVIAVLFSTLSLYMLKPEPHGAHDWIVSFLSTGALFSAFWSGRFVAKGQR